MEKIIYREKMMLVDKDKFQLVEDILREQGVIDRFEAENGPITGHMMITLSEIPSNLEFNFQGDNVQVFCASFDFYDMTIGIAIDSETLEPVSSFWFTPQREGALEPSSEWVEFFARTLFENLSEQGFGIPIYCFVNDHSDFTVIPSQSQSRGLSDE